MLFLKVGIAFMYFLAFFSSGSDQC